MARQAGSEASVPRSRARIARRQEAEFRGGLQQEAVSNVQRRWFQQKKREVSRTQAVKRCAGRRRGREGRRSENATRGYGNHPGERWRRQ